MKKLMIVLVLTTLIIGSGFCGGNTEEVANEEPAMESVSLGSELIGDMEGPEVIRDLANYPTKFNESPVLSDMVNKGELPALENRLPKRSDLMVVKPLDEIGEYGGNWRRGFTGPADHENGNRIVSSDKILFFDYTGTKINPSLAKDWKVSEDGKVITIYLREGAKWSDGYPLTADDFIFWYNDIYSNTELVPIPFFEFQINGKEGTMRKVDDYTVEFVFPESYPYFEYVLAGSTSIGGGFATRGAFGTWGGGYAPAHYLKQFLPKYSSEEAVNENAKALGFDTWIALLRDRYSWALNPELPVMTPWKTVTPINTPTWTLERNPYYWAVDTEGNQLPYIDKITMTLAEDTEIINLRAMAGEYDFQSRHLGMQKLPVFLDNQEKGDYTVYLDPASYGSDMTIFVGMAYDGDPEVAKWLRTKSFRNALSLGIDRDQLNEAFWLGIGVPGSCVPSPDSLYSPGPEWNKLWAAHDVEQANSLLDSIGLDKKDSEGYRLRTDGKGRLRLEINTDAGSEFGYTQVAEMIKQQWKDIGIDLEVKELERSLNLIRNNNDENQLTVGGGDGTEMIYLFARKALPVDTGESNMGMAYAKWYSSNGEQGTKPEDPEMIRAMNLFRNAFGMQKEGQIESAQEIWKIIADQQWSIGTVGQSPAFKGIRIVSNNMGNIPERQLNAQHGRTPASSAPATFFFFK
jgi:peptide/nickel transport system substrate-binding protein